MMMQTSEVLSPTGGCRRKCAAKDPAFFTFTLVAVALAFAAFALEDSTALGDAFALADILGDAFALEDSGACDACICRTSAFFSGSDSAIDPSSQNSFFQIAWETSGYNVTELRSGEAHHA